jgi:hypothetical protein
MGNQLDKGKSFPTLSLGLVNDGTINLPSDFITDASVVLFYREHW